MTDPTQEGSSGSRGTFDQILRSSSIIGAASVINIVAGIVRQKAAALILGPAGVGLMGLLQNLVAIGTSLASISVGSSATRQIATASARNEPEAVAWVRRGLRSLAVLQVFVGMTAFWLMRGWLARVVLHDEGQSATIGWLTLGLGFGLIVGAQSGMLLGFRRIGDSARVTVISALASAIAGVVLLYLFRSAAIAPFVILPTAFAAIAGAIYVRRLPRPAAVHCPFRDILGQWRKLAGLGLALTAGASASVLAQLLLRMMIHRKLGDAPLGLFQASATLSMVYLGFILQAMGADYAPRLAMAIEDREAANRMVNEQTEVALLLAAPFLLLALGAAPWLFRLFYSSAFIDAAAIFRWQVLGDVLKLASWPLGFIMYARGEGKTFLVTETAAALFLLALAWLAIPRFGIVAAGVAYFGMYLLYLPIVYWIARRRMGFRWSTRVIRDLLIVAAACTFVAAISAQTEKLALAAGVLLAFFAAAFAYRRLGFFLPQKFKRR